MRIVSSRQKHTLHLLAKVAAAFAVSVFLPMTSGAADKPSAAKPGGKQFAGKTLTVAVGSFMSSGVTMFKNEWERASGAKLQVVEIPFGDLYQRLFTSFTTG